VVEGAGSGQDNYLTGDPLKCHDQLKVPFQAELDDHAPEKERK